MYGCYDWCCWLYLYLVHEICISWCVDLYLCKTAVLCIFMVGSMFMDAWCLSSFARIYRMWYSYQWVCSPGMTSPLACVSSGICIYYVYSALHFWYECDYWHLCVCMYLSFSVIINFGTYSQNICLRYIFLLCWVWVMWLKTQYRLGSSGLASGFSVEL